MTRATTYGVTLTLVLAAAGVTIAQVKTIPGQTETASATVEAIERATRQVTLKNEDGRYEVLYVPTEVKRFDALKVGDTIKVRYYETVTLRPHPAGEKPIDTTASGITPAAGEKRAGTVALQRTITATITAIDPKIPTVTFSGPNGWTYSSRVEDKAALAKVKVGDMLDITWTSAMLLAIEDVK
jgi:hypothetical protein